MCQIVVVFGIDYFEYFKFEYQIFDVVKCYVSVCFGIVKMMVGVFFDQMYWF